MKETVRNFLNFLSEEHSYLTNIKIFLIKIPKLITSGDINELEFQKFLEKYELESLRFVKEQKHFKEKISEELNLRPEQVTYRMLVSMGFDEFSELGRRVLRITNEITMLLLKTSVYLKNFSRLQGEFMRLNNFLYRHDYSARGTESSYTYKPGMNFYGEA
jgi:hemerythrin-like domain-containing protein